MNVVVVVVVVVVVNGSAVNVNVTRKSPLSFVDQGIGRTFTSTIRSSTTTTTTTTTTT